MTSGHLTADYQAETWWGPHPGETSTNAKWHA